MVRSTHEVTHPCVVPVFSATHESFCQVNITSWISKARFHATAEVSGRKYKKKGKLESDGVDYNMRQDLPTPGRRNSICITQAYRTAKVLKKPGLS